FFDDELNEKILSQGVYADTTESRTYNDEDSILDSENADGYNAYASTELLGETETDGILAYITIGVDPTFETSITSTNYVTAGLDQFSMLLYMLAGKVKGRNRRQGRIPRSKPSKNHFKPIALIHNKYVYTDVNRSNLSRQFYPVDPPQEFDDEPGKELGPDAQVWKAYVRETDQVDGELVDGWNKSMDVILIFAALFSAISTAFVIESYKNLKQDPVDLSAQTLLIISQTLAVIANGSQVSGTQPPAGSPLEAPPFSVP
ncbi:unnamed protein product, partial [Rhizoctonia solani]